MVCAVSDAPVGCDLERARVLKRDISRRICSDAERAAVRSNTDLFTLWTGKEAVLKAIGLGLRLPLSGIEVGLAERVHLAVNDTSCVLRRTKMEDDWNLAICVVGMDDFAIQLIPTVA